jgi:hypothetical protein
VDQTREFFILEASDERLASAPPFEKDSITESQAEDVYRYFGQ